ncbi:MAG: nucleotidyltransferase family protein [Gammaproteobacteria bacterium]|nr:nucleotidyltransferase family protein [Gammaproteobacteria bacterium]
MIAGVLLAAGASSRFGGDKRLHRLADGTGMALAALHSLRDALDEVIAVVRPGDGALATQLGSAGARVVVAHDWRSGMGSSLAFGVAALDARATACLIALADMPFVRAATVSRTAAPLRQGASLVAPVYRGSRGHPVGFAAEWFSTLRRLRGEHGARDLLAVHRDRLTLVEVDDPGILLDIDYPDDLSTPRG